MSIIKTGVLSGESIHASKHVRVRIAWIKERTDNDEFVTIYCPTDLMISDGLTKPKTANSHVEYCDMIGVVPDPRSDPSKERAEKNVLFMHDSSATYDSTTMYPSTEYSTDTSDVRASRGYTDLVSLHKQDVSVNPELSIFE